MLAQSWENDEQIIAIFDRLDNSYVDNPDAVMVSSGDDGYYPAFQQSTRVCKVCGRPGCDLQVCRTMRENVLKHGTVRTPTYARGKTMTMAGRPQMKDAVRRGLKARTRVNQLRRQNGRRTFGGRAEVYTGNRRRPYPLAGKIISEAKKLMAPLIAELEREEPWLTSGSAAVYQTAALGVGCDEDIGEPMTLQQVSPSQAAPLPQQGEQT